MKTLDRPPKNQQGLGLIEVMMASVIVGAVVLAFMRVSDQMNKTQTRMFEMMELQDLVQNLRYDLGDSLACSKTFEKTFPDRKIPLSGKFDALFDRHSRKIAQAGEARGKVIVESIDFRADQEDISLLAGAPGVVKFKLNIRFKGKHSDFVKTQSLTTPVLGEYNSAEKKFRFDYCDSMSSPFAKEVVDLTMKRVCSSLNAKYDQASGNCDMGAAMSELMGGSLNNLKGADIQKVFESVFPSQ